MTKCSDSDWAAATAPRPLYGVKKRSSYCRACSALNPTPCSVLAVTRSRSPMKTANFLVDDTETTH